jgi:hypothetical protein
MPDGSSPRSPLTLSVIVTIVDGGATLERCLAALSAQTDPPPLEILVPYDDTVGGITSMAARFPDVRFLPMGSVETRRQVSGYAGQHELFDRRRSFGLAAAAGGLIAIVEDRGAPRRDWAHSLARLHRELPHAVIGGAVDNDCDQPLHWAVFFCDFGRYQPPFDAGPRDYVTDVNVCYKRSAIDATRDLWAQRYHETTVHWALLNAGETLYLTPEPVVDELRAGLRLAGAVRERVTWGRLFAYTRVRNRSLAMRLGAAALTPLLPFILFARQFRLQLAKRAPFGRYLRAAPAMFLLFVAWSAGEMFGYVTGEA